MRKKFFLFIFLLGGLTSTFSQQKTDIVEATLNGLRFEFDASSGAILKMSHAATGTILHTSRDSAGLVDMAFPLPEFEPLRMASRYSKNAKIITSENSVTIHWDELGASRTFPKYSGKISATVILKADPDGQVVTLSCKVKNGTDKSIPQIIFPDFIGILPFNGIKETEFRTGGGSVKPFVDMQVGDHDTFFASDGSLKRYRYGFVMDGRGPIIKWMDIGGRNSGLSIYAKNWGVNGGFSENIYLKLSELTQKLRFMHTLSLTIEPGADWQSAEFVLNAHSNGWAKGIEHYRDYAKQNIHRKYPVPAHIRDGIGYRTVWMCFTFYTNDPKSKNFSFNELPAVAREAKQFGLHEMSLWGWCKEGFTLPIPSANPTVGTEHEMLKAFADCKKLGVNVAPFVSVMTAGPKTAPKYGLTGGDGYNFDVDFLPTGNPSYAKAQKGGSIVPSSNKLWQEEVLSSIKTMIDSGMTSFGWDQYFNVGPGRSMDTITNKIREMATAKDPQSTFSGEAGTNMENECDYLDYTWNWDYHDNADWRPVISALPGGPRINWSIDRSASETRMRFADNYFLNVYPRKKDRVNGSDLISNHPQLAAALKQAARLRKQFLNYFVDGSFVADCILPAEDKDIHVSSYVLPKSMMVIVINKKAKRPVNFTAILDPWLKSANGRYKVKEYNDGVLTRAAYEVGPEWRQKISSMDNQGIYIYEITAN